MLWERESYEPNPAAEIDDIIFSLVASLERLTSVRSTIRAEDIDPWCLPQAPHQCQISASMRKTKFLLFSWYMRPWSLCPEWAETHAPYIGNLERVPREHMSPDLQSVIRAAGFSAETLQEEVRSHEFSWRSYIRGHVMSLHAKRLVVQFIAACCGRSADHGADDGEDADISAKDHAVPDNEMSLQRIHALIDGMSRAEDEESRKAQSQKQTPAEFPADHPADDVPEDPNLSSAVKDALVTTGKLWTRERGPEAAWSAQHRSHASLSERPEAA